MPTEGDDPFAVFGDDDDDDDSDDDEDQKVGKEEAQSLVERINQRMMKQQQQRLAEKTKDDIQQKNSSSSPPTTNNDNNNLQILENLPWNPPLYLCPHLACVALGQYGGGRGLVATRELPAGTLLMVEQPILEWPEEQIGQELGIMSIQHVLQQVAAASASNDAHHPSLTLMRDLEHLYPTKQQVDSLTEEEEEKNIQIGPMLELLHRRWKKELPDLIHYAATTCVTNFTNEKEPLSERDLLRMLLALRYNGFESGVYLYLAMLNHDDYPNSVKFATSSQQQQQQHPEVRTTRAVQAGEAITISYHSKLVSHATMRFHLWEQHRFDIGNDVVKKYKQLQQVGGLIPDSWLEKRNDENAPTRRTEVAIDALEEHFQELTASMALMIHNNQTEKNNTQQQQQPPSVWDEVKALEVSSLELYRQAKEQLQNPNHLLLIPCLRLHLNVCDILLLHHTAEASPSHTCLTRSQQVLLQLRMVQSAHAIIPLQTLLYGPDHYDLAQSYNELSQALAQLLTEAPQQLYALAAKPLDDGTVNDDFDNTLLCFQTFHSCSSLEAKCRQEFERIRNLYPRDAQEYISRTAATK